MFSAVICDMDGLLLDTERISLELWQQASNEFGWELPAEVFGLWIGRRPVDNVSIAHKELGDDFPFWEIRERRTELMDELIAAGNLPIKAGAKELLSTISGSGTSLAVATSTATEVAKNFLEQLELISYIGPLVGGEQVDNGKPAPDIFVKTAEQLGVEASACIVLEDSGPGIRAAAAAGMAAVAVPDIAFLHDEERQLAHAVCDDLHQALQEVLRLLNQT